MPKFYFLLLSLLSTISYSQGYQIDIKFKGAENKKIYLGTYYGNQKLIVDSVLLDGTGSGRFSGEKGLEQGLYIIALPDITYFDIIVSNDQKFSVYNDIADITNNLKITGSDENEYFSDFQKFTYNKQLEIKAIDTKLPEKQIAFKKDSLFRLIYTRRKEIIAKYKGTLFTNMLIAMEEPDVPDSIVALGEEAAFQYYKRNYFNNIDFSDERLTKTPIIYNKINHFFLNLCEWHPDSVTKYALLLCEKSENNKNFFYYVFNHLYRGLSLSGKFMNDEAYVALMKKYMDSGKLWWADETLISSFKTTVKMLDPTLSGSVAPPLSLKDVKNADFNISNVKTDWFILFLWETDCKHCAAFYEKLKTLAGKPEYAGITFIAVNSTGDFNKWKTFIEGNPAPFIQTIADPANPKQLDAWNLFATPRIFVLDNSMHIRLKDPDPDKILLYLYGK
jgi:hypothetical protein